MAADVGVGKLKSEGKAELVKLRRGIVCLKWNVRVGLAGRSAVRLPDEVAWKSLKLTICPRMIGGCSQRLKWPAPPSNSFMVQVVPERDLATQDMKIAALFHFQQCFDHPVIFLL